jgi:fructose-1,6-bisphosphatase/inositol monophosphatase family enzyme
MPYHRNLQDHQVSTKAHDEDFVTIADREAEEFLCPILQKLVPESVVLGEEAFSTNPEILHAISLSKDVWIIDPVDGTGNFRKGLDDFCVMVAHASKGKLVGAWIYIPIANKFAAWQIGENVTVNKQTVSLDTKPKPLSEMIVGEHISFCRIDDKSVIRNNRSVFGSCISIGSFGVEVVMMLENEIDALSFGVGNPFDIAPCAALITACGGRALKIDGMAVEDKALFDMSGAFLAVRSSEQWQEVRDTMLHTVDWKKYFD